MKKLLQIVMMLLFVTSVAVAQDRTVSGMVSDKDGALTGVNVKAKGGSANTTTDANGKFSLRVPSSTTALVVSFIGMATQEVAIPASGVVNVTMSDDAGALGEVVISVGSRATQRTVIDAPVPVDIFSSKDLRSTGQNTFDKALQYRVPSFNTVNTPVNDATTLLDPYELRNMGPSRTLILINGKRKNLSSLLYVQFSPGRGETGVDLSAIPQEAIERVEILRDGASAQYGSDAIAGVMNVILKSKYDYSSLNVNAGVTGKGDGKTYSVALNSGHSSDKGFINYTAGFQQVGNAIRSGTIHVPTEIATFGDGNGSPQDKLIESYLKDYPTGGNLNGTGETTAGRFLINGGLNFGEKGQLYANAAMVVKKVVSNANFRTPYWRQDRGLLHSTTDNNGKNYITKETLAFSSDDVDLYKGYIGYMPTFEGDLRDYNATIGAKNEISGWKTDVSLTTGGNSQLYTVNNTVNRSLGKSSPTTFKPGGFGFSHLVGNIDVSKNLLDNVSLSMGAEARSETYKIIAGDTASYSGQGSNSFPGINAINATTNSRFNVGAYVDANWDVTKDFLINAAVRTEKYSDFGTTTVFKASTRYKLADDKFVLRASYSTGFRAPTLHQIYAQSVQASFAGGTIVSSGLFNNNSKEARKLEVPKLTPEKSTNLALGFGFNPSKNTSITVDYYNIQVKDRIVYSSSISSPSSNKKDAAGNTLKDSELAIPTTDLGKILKGASVGEGKGKADLNSVQFFINGIETRTSGLDIVFSQRNIELGSGKLAVNLAANYVLGNEIVGTPNEPRPIAAAKRSILNEQIKSLLTESRPKYKGILGLDYAVGKLNLNLSNTLFGSTAFRDFDNANDISYIDSNKEKQSISAMNEIKAIFKPAIVTDLSIGYNFTDKVSLTLNVNNLLNVLPKWDLKQETVNTDANATDQAARVASANAVLADKNAKDLLRGFLGFSGRYDILGYNGSQFSQLGRMFNMNLNVKF
jgi:iron complex outermembrane recepter protein